MDAATRADAIARIEARTKVNGDGCWIWTGSKKPGGYGQMSFAGRVTVVIRVAYEAHVGPIPDGHHLDHYRINPGPRQAPCTRACVNPAHLEPVTAAENVLRGGGWSGRNARKTQCPQGHAYTPENTYRGRDGRRQCRTCRGVRNAKPRNAEQLESCRVRARRYRADAKANQVTSGRITR